MNPDRPFIGQVYDEINARGYGKGYLAPLERAEDHFVNRRIRRAIRELHKDYGVHPHILDVGSGTSEFLRSHKVPPSRYTGLDLSRLMVSEARREFPEYANSFRCADFLKYSPADKPDLIVALWGPFNYAGFIESLRWSAETLAEGGRLCAVVYSHGHHYRDKSLYPPSVAKHLRDVSPVGRVGAETALGEHFPSSRKSVLPFSSKQIATVPNVGHWRWTYDRLKLSVDYAKDSRYLWLEAQRP